MNKNYKYESQQRQNTKQRMVDAFGNKCGICSGTFIKEVYDFHHLDPNEKEFTISNIKHKSQDAFVIELKKCVMLCSNCHREIHAGIKEIPIDIPRFNELYTIYKQDKSNQFDQCPVCDQLKSIYQITCSKKCAGKHRYKVDQSKYDLELLYSEIGSFVGIARYIGNISDVAVKKRMKKLGLL